MSSPILIHHPHIRDIHLSIHLSIHKLLQVSNTNATYIRFIIVAVLFVNRKRLKNEGEGNVYLDAEYYLCCLCYIA